MDEIQRKPRLSGILAVAVSLLVFATACVTPAGALAPERKTPIQVVDEERREGYVWLDVDCNPLPFQSDDAIKEFLRTASVESMEKLPTGVTEPRKVVLAAEGVRMHAEFKDVEDNRKDVTERIAGHRYTFREWRDTFVFDIVAYEVDRLLKMDRVPPIVPRTIEKRKGSLGAWVEGTITEKMRRDRAIEPPDDFRWNQQQKILHVFDNLVGNRDSNLGNTLIDGNWRVWFIDCGRCFGTTKKLFYPQAITHCERGLWQALQNLDPAQVRERLGPYLTRHEINALLARRDKVVEHIQGLIDELGEARVIFDLRPPTERAPWAKD